MRRAAACSPPRARFIAWVRRRKRSTPAISRRPPTVTTRRGMSLNMRFHSSHRGARRAPPPQPQAVREHRHARQGHGRCRNTWLCSPTRAPVSSARARGRGRRLQSERAAPCGRPSRPPSRSRLRSRRRAVRRGRAVAPRALGLGCARGERELRRRQRRRDVAVGGIVGVLVLQRVGDGDRLRICRRRPRQCERALVGRRAGRQIRAFPASWADPPPRGRSSRRRRARSCR